MKERKISHHRVLSRVRFLFKQKCILHVCVCVCARVRLHGPMKGDSNKHSTCIVRSMEHQKMWYLQVRKCSVRVKKLSLTRCHLALT